MKKAFTLAEVLITLGIIGVVAAMTMPTLINNQKNATLQAQLKKSYSTTSQALLNWKNETGMIGLYKMFATYNGTEYVNSSTFTTQYMQQLKAIGKATYKNTPKNYNRTKNINTESRTCIPDTTLPDGSAICTFIYSGTISVTVDINGTQKNPNAWGHDIFTFVVTRDSEELVGMKSTKAEPDPNSAYPEGDGLPCSSKVQTAGNGLGCAYYALINQCPDDNTKTYWECLP